MEKFITDKNYIIVLINDIRIWITELEYQKIKKLLEMGKSFIEVNGDIVNTNTISFAGSRANIDEIDKIKRGEWKCEFDFWHEKYQQCAHGDKLRFEKT